MVKNGMLPALSLTALLLAAPVAASSESDKDARKSHPAAPSNARAATPAAAESAASPAKAEARPSLGDGIIAQNALRIYLTRPATVTVHNTRGQLLLHIDSSRPMEYLPLSHVHAGFLYLTFRAGPLESTQKLIYSGK